MSNSKHGSFSKKITIHTHIMLKTWVFFNKNYDLDPYHAQNVGLFQ